MAEEEPRATIVGGEVVAVGLGLRVLASECGMRHVDPFLLPLPDWAGDLLIHLMKSLIHLKQICHLEWPSSKKNNISILKNCQ